MRRRGILPACLLAAVLPVAAVAQEGKPATPFDTAVQAALADAGGAASLMRCSGLFRAFRLLAGETTDLARGAARRETDLAVAAVVVWRSETGAESTDAALDAIVPMIREVADLYQARMIARREAAGTVFDATLEAELTYCTTLHDEIGARVSE